MSDLLSQSICEIKVLIAKLIRVISKVEFIISAQTVHIAREESQTGAICPSLALLAHSAFLTYTAHFARAEWHTQTCVICPSLALLAHSVLSAYTAHFAHTETQTVDRSFSTLRRHCSLCSRRIGAHGIALFALQECHLVGDQGAFLWHVSHDLPRASTKVSAKSDHKQMKYSTLCPLVADLDATWWHDIPQPST